jgi:hypothetical protein
MANEQMEFPETWEEYEKEYGFNDSKEAYTNNSRLIPSFRVKQWLNHLPSIQPKTKTDVLDKIRAEIGQTDFDFGDFYDHTDTIIQIVLEIIDKYRTESEDKE